VIVLVHGVPETAAIWDRLRTYLPPDTVALRLPGFGTERPDAFAATKDGYLSWLARELAQLGEPVHLVGHDWGAALTYRLALTRPELLRSWIADAAYVMHPDHRWHELARTWQTRGEGEAFWHAYLERPVVAAATGFAAYGVAGEDARGLAGMADPVMAGAVLDLYRSATPNLHHDWPLPAAAPPRSMPGPVLDAVDDPFGGSQHSTEVAAGMGAPVASLDGLGHWWLLQDPARVARTMRARWEET
jgi:pimeloyl-ACP methyl ester carboxylesterase